MALFLSDHNTDHKKNSVTKKVLYCPQEVTDGTYLMHVPEHSKLLS